MGEILMTLKAVWIPHSEDCIRNDNLVIVEFSAPLRQAQGRLYVTPGAGSSQTRGTNDKSGLDTSNEMPALSVMEWEKYIRVLKDLA
jgi:hypothetical protein